MTLIVPSSQGATTMKKVTNDEWHRVPRKVMIYVYLDLNDEGRLYFTTSPQVYMDAEDMRYQYSFEHEVRPEYWRGEVRKIGTNDVAERALIGEAYDAARASADAARAAADAAYAAALDTAYFAAFDASEVACEAAEAAAEKLKPWYRQFCKRPTFNDEYPATFSPADAGRDVDNWVKRYEEMTNDEID